MIITLELTDNNGIIKQIESNKDNGGIYNKTDVYLLDANSNNNFTNNKKFLNDLIKDLGLYTGNIHDKKNLVLDNKFGHEYHLSLEELKTEYLSLTNRLKFIENELKLLAIDTTVLSEKNKQLNE